MILNKKELEQLYYAKTNAEVCEELGITNPTLISYLKKFGIKTKGLGYGARKERKTKIKLDL
jgi:hypothetical protein